MALAREPTQLAEVERRRPPASSERGSCGRTWPMRSRSRSVAHLTSSLPVVEPADGLENGLRVAFAALPRAPVRSAFARLRWLPNRSRWARTWGSDLRHEVPGTASGCAAAPIAPPWRGCGRRRNQPAPKEAKHFKRCHSVTVHVETHTRTASHGCRSYGGLRRTPISVPAMEGARRSERRPRDP